MSAFSGYTATQASFTGDPVFVVTPFIEYKTAFHGATHWLPCCSTGSALAGDKKSSFRCSLTDFFYGMWGDTLKSLIWELTTPFGHGAHVPYLPNQGWLGADCGRESRILRKAFHSHDRAAGLFHSDSLVYSRENRSRTTSQKLTFKLKLVDAIHKDLDIYMKLLKPKK